VIKRIKRIRRASRVIGFYTDEKKRVRPITASSGKRKIVKIKVKTKESPKNVVHISDYENSQHITILDRERRAIYAIHVWKDFKGQEKVVKEVVIRVDRYLPRDEFDALRAHARKVAQKYGENKRFMVSVLKIRGHTLEEDYKWLVTGEIPKKK